MKQICKQRSTVPPIRIPTVCWNTCPPSMTKILSIRKFSMSMMLCSSYFFGAIRMFLNKICLFHFIIDNQILVSKFCFVVLNVLEFSCPFNNVWLMLYNPSEVITGHTLLLYNPLFSRRNQCPHSAVTMWLECTWLVSDLEKLHCYSYQVN